MEFIQKGHPRHLHISSWLVQSVAPGLKSLGRNDIPYGLFVATFEVNPESSRPLWSAANLEEYRHRYPVLIFSHEWQSWEQVVSQFQ